MDTKTKTKRPTIGRVLKTAVITAFGTPATIRFAEAMYDAGAATWESISLAIGGTGLGIATMWWMIKTPWSPEPALPGDQVEELPASHRLAQLAYQYRVASQEGHEARKAELRNEFNRIVAEERAEAKAACQNKDNARYGS